VHSKSINTIACALPRVRFPAGEDRFFSPLLFEIIPIKSRVFLGGGGYFVTNSVDIKLSVHDAPPEQSALDTLKIERQIDVKLKKWKMLPLYPGHHPPGSQCKDTAILN
jgi:hypothetical protein